MYIYHTILLIYHPNLVYVLLQLYVCFISHVTLMYNLSTISVLSYNDLTKFRNSEQALYCQVKDGPAYNNND